METINIRCDRCDDDCTDQHVNLHVMDWGWRMGAGPRTKLLDGSNDLHLCGDCAREFLPSFRRWLASDAAA